MIETQNLTKKFGDFTAVNSLSLSIQPGEIFGLLGPNGSGKSTTLNMILGRLKPSSGGVLLFGRPFDGSDGKVKKRIGVVFESHPQIWPWATGREYLHFFGRLYEAENIKSRAEEHLEQLGLSAFADEPFHTYSRGMFQRLNIIRALLPDPDILVMDEPISGLDVIGIREVRDLIQQSRRDDRSIIISSHILSEMERICDRAGIIFKGRIQAVGPMDELTRSNCIKIELRDISNTLMGELRGKPWIKNCTSETNGIIVTTENDKDYREELSSLIYSQGQTPLAFYEIKGSLEETMMKYADSFNENEE